MILRPRTRLEAARAAILAGLSAGLCASLAACAKPGPAPAVEGSADHILIEKAAHRMTLLAGDRPVRTYRVSLGHGGLAAKTREGDGLTPEGDYRIAGRNPKSAYHLSLRIGYPTPTQVAEARRVGAEPGGDIMIHGLPNGRGALAKFYAGRDWTDGCVAVNDAEMDEIWRLTANGAAVHIAP